MRRVRRHALPLLLSTIALLLAACAGQAAAPAAPTAAPTAPVAAVQAAAPADELRWSLEGTPDLRSIDPAKPGDAPAVTVISQIFTGLVRLNERLEVEPDGAQDWEVSDDGTVYTFTIREGLTFADGTPVTAEDYVYSINRSLRPELSFGAFSQLARIVGASDVNQGKTESVSGVRAIDPRTLEITLDSPVAYFLSQLSYPYTYAVPKELVETGEGWEDRAYGSGPYQIEEWKHGEYVLLKGNDHYYRGKPSIPKIRFIFNQDSEIALRRYQAGELDIIGSGQNPIPVARVAALQNLPDFKSASDLRTRYVGFNNQRAPFDNVDVRRAFAQAVDKASLVRDVLAGQAYPATRILPSGMLGTQQPIRPLAFNPTAAEESLEKAGFPGGAGFPEVTLTYAAEGDNKLVVEALKKGWEEHLGVKVTLQELDLPAFSNSLDATTRDPANGLQFYYSAWGADYPDPQNFLSLQLHSGTVYNNGHWYNPTFDLLVDEADKLGDRTQIDRRIKLYNQAEQIAIDEVGWLPIFHPRFNVLLHPRVEGIVITPNGFLIKDWTQARLK